MPRRPKPSKPKGTILVDGDDDDPVVFLRRFVEGIVTAVLASIRPDKVHAPAEVISLFKAKSHMWTKSGEHAGFLTFEAAWDLFTTHLELGTPEALAQLPVKKARSCFCRL